MALPDLRTIARGYGFVEGAPGEALDMYISRPGEQGAKATVEAQIWYDGETHGTFTSRVGAQRVAAIYEHAGVEVLFRQALAHLAIVNVDELGLPVDLVAAVEAVLPQPWLSAQERPEFRFLLCESGIAPNRPTPDYLGLGEISSPEGGLLRVSWRGALEAAPNEQPQTFDAPFELAAEFRRRIAASISRDIERRYDTNYDHPDRVGGSGPPFVGTIDAVDGVAPGGEIQPSGELDLRVSSAGKPVSELVELELNYSPSPEQIQHLKEAAERVLGEAIVLVESGRVQDEVQSIEIQNTCRALRDELYSPSGRPPNPRIVEGLAVRLSEHLVTDAQAQDAVPPELAFLPGDVEVLAAAESDVEFIEVAPEIAQDLADHLDPEWLAGQADFDAVAGPREFFIGRLGWTETAGNYLATFVGDDSPMRVTIGVGAAVGSPFGMGALAGPVAGGLTAVVMVIVAILATNARNRAGREPPS